MPHQINLRQVEAFKAVIETGTISRAADILHLTQPAVSKLIAHLEMDTGLKLFDRHNKRRLAPTEQGMSLYEAVCAKSRVRSTRFGALSRVAYR
jgi:DNA-binding transcriptional LysR family regulator